MEKLLSKFDREKSSVSHVCAISMGNNKYYFTVSIQRYVIKSDQVFIFSAGCLQSIYAGTNKATAAGNSSGGDRFLLWNGSGGLCTRRH